MKALLGAFNQEKALVGAFSVIVQPVVEPMDCFTALQASCGLAAAQIKSTSSKHKSKVSDAKQDQSTAGH